MMRDEKGLTLIELAIVALIIGIMAAIGITMFRNTGSAAKDKACKSNLKNIDIAIQLYKNNHPTDPESIDNLISAKLLKRRPKEPHFGYGEYTIVNGQAHADENHQTY